MANTDAEPYDILQQLSLTLQYAIPVCMQTAIISQLWILGHTLALFVAILMTWIWTYFLRFIWAWAAGPRIVSATSRHAAGYFCADDWVDVVFRGTFRIWTWIHIWRHNIYKLRWSKRCSKIGFFIFHFRIDVWQAVGEPRRIALRFSGV